MQQRVDVEALFEQLHAIGRACGLRAQLVRPAQDIGRDAADELAGTDAALEDEARYLADLRVHLLPAEPEVLGLAACINLAGARRAARVTPDGRYVSL